ncbi:hypothetical protein AaE_015735 [Aphanomyces astaci]|uniref:Reverse transcriptase Ty1/copia-type domain-containing protein n=1 Tax=Aphanomyces astaci TaxID=112090 RepID=A0A6A4Z128_APHAT|nr:hypothetical protein AaE_015735 [Aphanomyces astaci]
MACSRQIRIRVFTYVLVKRRHDETVLPCRCVFRLKADGTYKARLVVKEFMEQKGIDYTDIFAPVVRLEVLRFLFALVAIHYLECGQMDVKTVFLNDKIDCFIRMEQPPGSLIDPMSRRDYVCLLQKSLYGLKQAPHFWYWTFVTFMVSLAFARLQKDRCVFLKASDDGFTIVSICVDDILIITPNKALATDLKASL